VYFIKIYVEKGGIGLKKIAITLIISGFVFFISGVAIYSINLLDFHNELVYGDTWNDPDALRRSFYPAYNLAYLVIAFGTISLILGVF